MLTFREAMRLFKISQATLYRWIREDKIARVEYNGEKMYPIDTLWQAYDKRHGG